MSTTRNDHRSSSDSAGAGVPPFGDGTIGVAGEAGRLADLTRRELAAAERLAEIEMMLAELGGGKGAELMVVESQIEAGQASLAEVETRLAAARAAHREAEALTAKVRAEMEEHRAKMTGPPALPCDLAGLEKAAAALPPVAAGASPEESLAQAIAVMALLDQLDGLSESAGDRAGLREKLTEKLARMNVYEFAINSGSAVTPDLRRMVAVSSGPLPNRAQTIAATLRPGFLFEPPGTPILPLRRALVSLPA